jgi:ABC-2 type transport system permease protein
MLAVLGTAVASGARSAPGGGAAIALWATVITHWLAAWLALCVVVNGRRGSSATHALRLVAVWLVLVVVAPALVNAIAQWIHPPPSRVELIGRMREASNAANARGTELLKQFFGDHPELAPPGSVDLQDFAARRLVVQAEVDRALAPMLDDFGGRLAAQHDIVQRWQWLSPAIAVHTVLLEAAGTGVTRYRAFEQAVTAFHARWLEFFGARIYAKRRMTADDYTQLPRWQWTEQAPRDRLRAVGASLAFLVATTSVLLVLAVRTSRRISPMA